MAGTVREARLGTRTARARLKPGRQPHWNTIIAGRAHLGWQRWPEDLVGRWLLRRRHAGAYHVEALGTADDRADGMTFEQARAKAVELAGMGETRPGGRFTVRRAIADYIDYLAAAGKPTRDIEGRAVTHILPKLGDVEVSALTSPQLRRWSTALAAAPALKRSRRGEQRSMPPPADDEAVRRRRSSANRMVTILKAALNHAYDERRVASNDAWGRRLKKFRGVDAARVRYLSVAEADRLLNACNPEFRPLVRAALETGCRYGELARLDVHDFNPDAGTVAVRRSKTGKGRHVVLTDEGAAFFRELCAGRAGHAIMLPRPDGERWRPSNQARPMMEACERASISPRISFHGLRHTWASLAAMAGVPLMVVARNLGHADTKMVEKHYGHLTDSFVFEAVRAGAPRFAVGERSKVTRGPMSRSFYQRMKERGEGPRETFLSATKIIITPQDELAWQEARANPRDAGARLARAEAMRRARARKAGRVSAAGPNHISKKRRRAEELEG
jgi:integrase